LPSDDVRHSHTQQLIIFTMWKNMPLHRPPASLSRIADRQRGTKQVSEVPPPQGQRTKHQTVTATPSRRNRSPSYP